MVRVKWFLITIFILFVFALGMYFNKDVNEQIKNFQQSDIGQTITQIAKQISTPQPLHIGGAENDSVLSQDKIIFETNVQRQENGNLQALLENSKLNAAALAKANDMFEKQYFEHVSPLGIGPGDLAQRYGYEYIIEGENLILGNFSSEKELVQYWMDSPGHRANILNNRYTEIGVAIIKGTYQGNSVWIGVQEFGLPLSSCPQPNDSLKNQVDLGKSQLSLLYADIQQDKDQIESLNQHSENYRQLVEIYNQKINQYNSLAQEIRQLVEEYNLQVNNFNNCVSNQ